MWHWAMIISAIWKLSMLQDRKYGKKRKASAITCQFRSQRWQRVYTFCVSPTGKVISYRNNSSEDNFITKTFGKRRSLSLGHMERKEIQLIASQLREVYDGGPWFGKSFITLTGEIPESVVFLKTAGSHSILELLWHMITWREFTVD